MKSRLDTEFGNLAVSEGFTTPEQFKSANALLMPLRLKTQESAFMLSCLIVGILRMNNGFIY